MEWKEDYAACQHAEIALRTQAAECSSAEGTLAQRHSDVWRNHDSLESSSSGVIGLDWSSVLLV